MRRPSAVIPLVLIGAGAAAGCALLAARVNAHATRDVDGRARQQLPKRRRRVTKAVAVGIGPLGKWWGQMPLAAAVASAAWRLRWVLSRDRVVAPAGVVPVAVALPLASGLAKLYLDKHWLTDVLGGYLAGLSVAAFAAAGYELGRPRRRRWTPALRGAMARMAR